MMVGEPDIDEFFCDGICDNYPFVTVDYCEGKACGFGCKDLKTCVNYLNQKELQNRFSAVSWDNIKIVCESFKAKINLIKKGVMIEPYMEDDDGFT